MDIVIVGGTGVLGAATVPRLVAAGHRVRGAARSEASAVRLRSLGAEPVLTDVFDPESVAKLVAGADVVVDVATSIPPTTTAWRPSAWEPNDRLRRDAAPIGARAAADGGARYVRESFAPAYPDRGDAWIVEDTPLEPGPQAVTVVDAERAAQAVDGTVLRFGFFLGPTSGMTQEHLAAVRRGLLPVFGPGDAYLATIHVDDAAAAVVAALDAEPGVYNVVDDQPRTRDEIVWSLEAMTGRRVRRLPAWLSRRGPLEPLSRSQRVSNGRLRDATGWAPRYHDVVAGWEELLGSSG